MHKNYTEIVLGSNPRARHKNFYDSLEERFKNPIIHKEIHGDKVYVPLDLSRVCISPLNSSILVQTAQCFFL